MVLPRTPTSSKRKSPRLKLKNETVSDSPAGGNKKKTAATRPSSSSYAKLPRLELEPDENIEPYNTVYSYEEDDDMAVTMNGTDIGNSIETDVHETSSSGRRDWEKEERYEMPVEPSYLRSVKRENVPYITSVTTQALEPLSDSFVEVSHNKKWNPISFARAEMFDHEAGVPLCRSSIEQNLKKLVKNKQEIDSSEFLELASSFNSNPPLQSLALGMAFLSEMLNKEIRSSKQPADQSGFSLNTFVTPKIGFNIGSARQNETFVYLPSGRRFMMSSTMNTFSSSNYTSSNYVTHAKSIVRRALTKVSQSDPFFAAYTSSETSSVYVPLGADFFRTISKFLMLGFSQNFSEELETFTIRLCRDVACSLLDRTRHQFHTNQSTTSTSELAADLKEIMKGRGGRMPTLTIDFSSSDHPTSQASTSSTFRM